MATYLNGQGGSLVYNSVTFCVESWTLTVKCEPLDVTTTCSGGWEEFIAGIKGGEGTGKAYFDSATIQVTTIKPGTSATMVLPVGSSVHQWTFTALITQIDNENPCKGVVPFNFNYKITGAITYPT